MSYSDLPDGTGGGGRETWARIAEISLLRAKGEQRETWAHRFDSNAAKILAETKSDDLLVLLEQAVATCRAWQAALIGRNIGPGDGRPKVPEEILLRAGEAALDWVNDTGECLFCSYSRLDRKHEGKHEDFCALAGTETFDLVKCQKCDGRGDIDRDSTRVDHDADGPRRTTCLKRDGGCDGTGFVKR